MWELAEVDTVSKHLVDLLHEVTSCLTVGAANIKLWGHEFSLLLASGSCIESIVTGCFVDNVSMSIN